MQGDTVNWLLIALVGVGLLLLLRTWLRRRASLEARPDALLLLLLVFLVLPTLVYVAASAEFLDDSKQTNFCLSCHQMEPFGASLRVEDDSSIPSVHFRNRLIPRDRACFTCHTDYTMFGTIKDKMRGLRHFVASLDGPRPEDIHLYAPFPPRNCLHCHEGSERFEQQEAHVMVDLKSLLAEGEVTCVESGCHDVAHRLDLVMGPPVSAPEGRAEEQHEN